MIAAVTAAIMVLSNQEQLQHILFYCKLLSGAHYQNSYSSLLLAAVPKLYLTASTYLLVEVPY